ncbi:MAG: putative sulfate exporter family transporter [Pseudomonadota bacterium]
MDAIIQKLRSLGPGLLLAGTIGAAAGFLSDHYGGPTMLFALLIGIAFNFLATEKSCAPGIGFSSKTLLRIGVALLGARITLGDLAALGLETVLVVIGLVALTVLTGFIGARLFDRKWRFALLTGGSVAICGASAALALAAVIPPNDKMERNTLFTVVAVTALSTIAMIVYPILFTTLNLTDQQSGFLVGATIHDVAQVVGAGYTISEDAGETATIVKLLRVTLLPIVVLAVILTVGRQGGGGTPLIPAFVIGFAALVCVNSFGLLPETVVTALGSLSQWALIIAIAALGVKTDLGAMATVGVGHIGVIALETVVLLAAALAVVYFGVLTFGSP